MYFKYVKVSSLQSVHANRVFGWLIKVQTYAYGTACISVYVEDECVYCIFITLGVMQLANGDYVIYQAPIA